MKSSQRNLDDLEARIRRWGRREPATPASVAAQRVVAGLGGPATSRAWPRRVALATAASLAGLTLWLTLGQPSRPGLPPAGTEGPPPLPENVVQFWLDPETPVYFVTGPLEPVKRGSP